MHITPTYQQRRRLRIPSINQLVKEPFQIKAILTHSTNPEPKRARLIPTANNNRQEPNGKTPTNPHRPLFDPITGDEDDQTHEVSFGEGRMPAIGSDDGPCSGTHGRASAFPHPPMHAARADFKLDLKLSRFPPVSPRRGGATGGIFPSGHAAAACSTTRLRPRRPPVTRTVSPSPSVPARMRSASRFCSSRWITRFSGRAP